jgi:hypothetical protein
MKEVITIQQWKELTELEQDFLESKDFDGKHYWHITLGKLIEYLHHDYKKLEMNSGTFICHTRFGVFTSETGEAIDSCWNAVKEKVKLVI